MGKDGPLTAARKPVAITTRRKSRLKRSQPLEQVSANPDITYEVRNILIELEYKYFYQIPTYQRCMFAHIFGFFKHLSNFNSKAVEKSYRITVLCLIFF
jgi:hypothetical protein